MCNNNIKNAAERKPGKKRRKKRRTGRKRKKAPQELSLLRSSSSSSSLPETERKEIINPYCFSLTQGVSISECSTAISEAEKRDEFTSTGANASNREGNNVSIRESFPETTAIIPTTTINSAAATTNTENSKPASANGVNDDPNELWLEYLWKTRSMIALDRYMDEMDDTLGEADCIG